MPHTARTDTIGGRRQQPTDEATYRIAKIDLPDGGTFSPAKNASPLRTEYNSPHVELLIPLGKDYTATLTFDQDAIAANPEIFVKQD